MSKLMRYVLIIILIFFIYFQISTNAPSQLLADLVLVRTCKAPTLASVLSVSSLTDQAASISTNVPVGTDQTVETASARTLWVPTAVAVPRASAMPAF